jgi:secondary thiamine-phosphate synthase enzyme
MEWFKTTLAVETRGKGLYNFTQLVENSLREWGVREGMCHLFVQHTSASLVVNESYDPTARMDMEVFMEKIAPEGEAWYRHTMEGADDSTSHMRAMLTNTSLSIPVDNSQLSMGTWQGIYLFEHRRRGHNRRVLLRCLKVE